MVINNWNKNNYKMTEQSSDSLSESLNDQCNIEEINGELELSFYANSDFNATSSDQVSNIC